MGLVLALMPLAVASFAGCGDPQLTINKFDPFGRTYYIDGAGNWGYGVIEVNEGLRQAGYHGNIVSFLWTSTFNPALDQTWGRGHARGRGRDLGREITLYCQKFPNNQANIIALSAGTGVAIWACENVQPPAKVNTVILLGSSLSSTYDMRKALPNISGGIWVYYSSSDAVLQGPVRVLGTIDGELGVDATGLVGLHPRGGSSDRIHNVAWSSRYERYGWSGAHTDGTSTPFVAHVLAEHIVPPAASTPRSADRKARPTAVPAAPRTMSRSLASQ